MTNNWVYGTAAHNGEGTHALYVSKDGGTTNEYAHSAATIFATKLFTLEDGMYSFSYDWKANGESTWDFLRVALVPDSVELEAGTSLPTGVGATAMPANWIALDGGSKLNLSTAWATKTVDQEVTAGLYKLVLLWRNDGTGGSQGPAAVDNIHITKLSCLTPKAVTASEIKAHTAKISWSAGEEGQNAWQLAYDKKASNQPDTLATLTSVNDSAYVLTDLDPSTTYYVYVRANCGEGDFSKWSAAKTFKTTVACPAPTNVEAILTPGNGTIATLKWSAGGDEQAWRVEYSANANMSDSIAVVVENDTTLDIEGLTAETTYYVRVLADCGQLDSLSAYSTKINFTTTNAYLLTLNEGTTINNFVPIYGSYVDEGTRSQFILPEEQLEAIEWDSIRSFTFYSSAASVDWGAATFEIYLAEAENETMTSWTAWENTTLVKSEGALAIVGGKMVVTLNEPYQYQGGNLLIGFKQIATGSWKSAPWYGVTAQGASMSGYGTNANAQRNFLPKVTIDYVPGVGPACPAPKKLKVTNVTATSASFSWKAVEGAEWEYAIAIENAEPNFVPVPENANTMVLDDLTEMTDYVFYLRRTCGDDGYSDTVSVAFATGEIAEVIVTSYSEDFEAASNWKLKNDVNAWAIGSAIAYAGEKALYISNDNGATFGYDAETRAVSFATKLFDFQDRGTFTVSYDWKNEGDYNAVDEHPEDYIRVLLVPATETFTAGVRPEGMSYGAALPEGWISLDQDTVLYGEADWQHLSTDVTVPELGLYRLVIVWVNDDFDSESTPGAIDNLSIAIKSYFTDIESGAGIKSKAYKFIQNGHVYFIVNDVLYDATGRKVK